MFGDDITDRAINGQTLKLDDDLTFGLRYAYSLTDPLAIELQLDDADFGNEARRQRYRSRPDDARRGRGMELQNGTRLCPMSRASVTPRRISIAASSARSARRRFRSRMTRASPSSTPVGAKYFFNDRFLIRAEARYRYLDKVVDRFDDSLNTVETTCSESAIASEQHMLLSSQRCIFQAHT